jgi:hypothetical protein
MQWLQQNEARDEFIEKRLRTDRATLTFGQGSRSCPGKNIVQLELYKLIATSCTRYSVSFDIELSNMNYVILIFYWKFHGVGKSELFEVYTVVGLRVIE